jgi:hypothetical protein
VVVAKVAAGNREKKVGGVGMANGKGLKIKGRS